MAMPPIASRLKDNTYITSEGLRSSQEDIELSSLTNDVRTQSLLTVSEGTREESRGPQSHIITVELPHPLSLQHQRSPHRTMIR